MDPPLCVCVCVCVYVCESDLFKVSSSWENNGPGEALILFPLLPPDISLIAQAFEPLYMDSC